MSIYRLIGGNKASIEQVLPHISTVMRGSIEELVQSSDVIVVGHDLHDGGEQLFNLLKPDQLVIDFVKITSSKSHPAAYGGICW